MKELAFVLLLFAANGSDCPDAAAGGAVVMVVDDEGRAVAEATVKFTAANWDSTLVQLSDASGKVAILCVPPGAGYDVTVLKAGYETAHVTTDAAPEPPTVRVILKPACH